jgi:hypothetical protein
VWGSEKNIIMWFEKKKYTRKKSHTEESVDERFSGIQSSTKSTKNAIYLSFLSVAFQYSKTW